VELFNVLGMVHNLGVSNGEVKAGPAKEKINTYTIIQSDGKVFLEL
jgi:hypothetical protein